MMCPHRHHHERSLNHCSKISPARLALPLLAILLFTGCGSEEQAEAWLEDGERLPGGEATNTLLFGRNAFIRPAENITPEHEPMFYSGNSFFNQAWVEAPASTRNRDGLGPNFNARSCAACHPRDGRGRPPESEEEPFLGLLLRLSIPGENSHGGPKPVEGYGDQLQPFGILGVPAEANPSVTYKEIEGTYGDGTPYTLLEPVYTLNDPAYGDFPDDMMVSPRIAPQVIGLGLLEAIPEDRLETLEDPEDRDGDGISGRINRVWDIRAGEHRPGRFGWKGDQPTVEQQVAGAFLGDIGITSPLIASGECEGPQVACAESLEAQHANTEDAAERLEIQDGNFERVVLYTSLLAVPARRNLEDPAVRQGKQLFLDAGCDGCHTPSHRTSADASLEETRDQKIWPYTDLLLHDMGEALADGRPVYDASSREWRTPPLWGLGLVDAVNDHTRLLHDGRARGFAEAILWHGGEAEASREAFRAMDAREREALIAFLESL